MPCCPARLLLQRSRAGPPAFLACRRQRVHRPGGGPTPLARAAGGEIPPRRPPPLAPRRARPARRPPASRLLLRGLADEAPRLPAPRLPVRLLWAVRGVRSTRSHATLPRHLALHRGAVRLPLPAVAWTDVRSPLGCLVWLSILGAVPLLWWASRKGTAPLPPTSRLPPPTPGARSSMGGS